MGSKLSQYDYSILTLKCVNLIQEKTKSHKLTVFFDLSFYTIQKIRLIYFIYPLAP